MQQRRLAVAVDYQWMNFDVANLMHALSFIIVEIAIATGDAAWMQEF
jgi:hypothetical protein